MDGKLDKLLSSVNVVLREKSGVRANGAVASNRTQEYTQQFMHETCRRLHRLGYILEDVDGLRERHIEALVKSWHAQGLANKTMQNQYSRLKTFCKWLGRPGIVDASGIGVGAYLPGVELAALKVSTVALVSKSWSGNGIDVIELLKKATLEDQRFGWMLTLGIFFGLRKKEMLRVKLWKADQIESLDIDGSVAKNGKPRRIWLEKGEAGQMQRWALDGAKAICKKTETLGWPGLNIKQAENRFYYYCKRIGLTKAELGVTTHGSRAEFMENMLLLRGLIPPTLGGTADQMPKAQRDQIALEVSRLAGHDDLHVASAYYGSFRKLQRHDGIGERIGSLLVDAETDVFASIYCSPPVQMDGNGKYRQKSEAERSETTVMILLEKLGTKPKALGLEEFVLTYEHLEPKVKAILEHVGLGIGPNA